MIGPILRAIAMLATRAGARELGATVARSAVTRSTRSTLAAAGRAFQAVEDFGGRTVGQFKAAMGGGAPETVAQGVEVEAPAAGKPFLDRVMERWERLRRDAAQGRYLNTPIPEQIKGLTLDQRQQRLEQAGRMVSPNQAAVHAGTPVPTMAQIVAASEHAEEKARQAAQADKERDQQSGIGGRMAKGLLLGWTPFLPVEEALRHFAERIADSNRGLAKFNTQIAESFAKRDVGELRAQFKMAQGTAGTAALLNDQLTKLIEEVQPLRQGMATMLNLMGTGLTLFARALALLMKIHPVAAAALKVSEKIEENTRKAKEAQLQGHIKDFLRDIKSGKYAAPTNPLPGAGNPFAGGAGRGSRP